MSSSPQYMLDLVRSSSVAPFMTLREFSPRQVVAIDGDPINEVIFPTSGLIACITTAGGGREIETALVGRGAAFAGSAGLGTMRHLYSGVACDPVKAWTLSAERARELAAESDAFRTGLFSAELFIMAQAQQLSACTSSHSIPQRFASWLLRAADQSGKDQICITQQEIAEQMGVQRASLSIVAKMLREKNIIEYRRGRILLKDRSALAGKACECAMVIREKRLRLLFSEEPTQAVGRSAAG